MASARSSSTLQRLPGMLAKKPQVVTCESAEVAKPPAKRDLAHGVARWALQRVAADGLQSSSSHKGYR